jgi:hypothetical protein
VRRFWAPGNPAWFENLRKRQVKSPKIYVRDSGVLHALLGVRDEHELVGHPKIGASWEGFAVEHNFIASRHPGCLFLGNPHRGARWEIMPYPFDELPKG